MKEQLKDLIIENIQKWTEKDIYAISLYVNDYNDNPCKPIVRLGYNTETQVKEQTEFASDEREARWNYAFWLQNSFLEFGDGESQNLVKQWLSNNEFPFYEDGDEAWDDDETYDIVEDITPEFIEVLIEIVQEIHDSGILTDKFGKEIPILIHELEYYEEIADENKEANGDCLDQEFVDWCANI